MLYIVVAVAFVALGILLGVLNWIGVTPGAGGAVTLTLLLALVSLGAAYLSHQRHRLNRYLRRHAHS